MKRFILWCFKLLIFLFITFTLTGCQKKDYTLHFKENMTIDLNSNDSPLVLIDKIGDVDITKNMIVDNKITIDNFIVSVEPIDTSSIKTIEVTYITNATQQHLFTKIITIKDISPPIIELDTPEISLDNINDFKDYDFFKHIKTLDNDDGEIKLSLNSDKEPQAGDIVTLTILAVDNAGNSSSKNMKVSIKEIVKEPEPQINSSSSGSNNSSSISNSSSSSSNNSSTNSNTTSNNSSSSSSESNSSSSNVYNGKFYDVNIYGDLLDCMYACGNDIKGISGICLPVYDEDGLGIGYEAILN